MTYYFIGLDPAPLEQFQRRLAFLSSGVWIMDMERLSKVLADLSEVPVFFLHQRKGELDDWAVRIRQTSGAAKIIYLTDGMGPQFLKDHQSGPAGGDAYVPGSITEEMLTRILEGLLAEDSNGALPPSGPEMEEFFSDLSALKKMLDHPLGREMDKLFTVDSVSPPSLPAIEIPIGEAMSDKDQELSLDDLGELELAAQEDIPAAPPAEDDGLSLNLDVSDQGPPLDLGGDSEESGECVLDSGDLGLEIIMVKEIDDSQEISLSHQRAVEEDDDISLNDEEEVIENLGDLEFSLDESPSSPEVLKATGSVPVAPEDETGFEVKATAANEELSDDARQKLMEIDELMVQDASEINISLPDDSNFDFSSDPESLDESLVADDLNLEDLDFSLESELSPLQDEKVSEIKAEIKPKKKKKGPSASESASDFRDISGAYSGEMERTQATIANLRADRGELLARIQQLEEEKVLHNRQSLTLRAELDERKIELSIIRKKLNEEISELKDRMRMQEERRLILEEKNRILLQELDKAGQKNKMDIKKVQMRERELEQKLELLKSDAETQIRNRDHKILELKRRIDAMEFDMESISQQEKRSVENRFELEDKLDKAIRTLRSAISVLEDDSDRGSAIEVLKKNIDV